MERGASLPSRERGLKHKCSYKPSPHNMSLPSRERGLKHLTIYHKKEVNQSLPSRERGLKPFESNVYQYNTPVAPFAGAWIETLLRYEARCSCRVAPFAGAWIETPHLMFPIPSLASLPSRERGLKHSNPNTSPSGTWSLPSRERGLKHIMPSRYILQKCRSLRGSVD